MEIVNRIWEYISNIGVVNGLDDLEVKKIRIINQLVLAICFAVMTGFFTNWFTGNENVYSLVNVINVFLYASIFFMHHKQFYITARVYLVAVTSLSHFLNAYLFGAGFQIEYAFVLMPPVSFILLPDKKRYHLTALILVVLCFIVCRIMYQYIDAPFQAQANSTWLVGTSLIFISYLLFQLFKYQTDVVLRKAQSLLKTVQIQKAEIEQKNANLTLAYKQLEQKQREIALIMNNSPSCISYVNKEYYYQFNNDTYCRWFGLTKEQLKNAHVKDIAGEDTFFKHTKERLDKTFLGEKQEYENIVDFNYIGRRHVKGTLVPDFDNNKQVQGCFIFVEDITPLKEVEIALRKEVAEHKRTEKMLMRYNEELKNFAYVTSHNLRSPLANIIGLLKLYDHQNPMNEFNSTIVENVEKSTETMDEVIKDLNDLISINKEKNALKTLIDFKETLNKTLQIIDKQIKEADAKIVADFTDVPQVRSVKSYIDSLLLNFLTNAIKYRSPKRLPLIQLKTEKILDNKVCLSIQDNGIGIDLAKNKDKIFGLYKRFHTHVDGRGLGLHLVKKQVESMGGSISVDSEVDKGTTFKVYL